MIHLGFLALLSILSLTSGLSVLLGHTATIPCNRSCSTLQWYRKKTLVSNFTDAILTVAPDYKDRIEFSEANLRRGNASLTITDVVYSDRNWYISSCNGEKGCDHYLEVLVPTSLSAVISNKFKLPCYAETDKLAAKSGAGIRWEKNDTLVVKLEHGKTETGAGFKDRFSVSGEDYKKGDLSLTIDDVRSSDAGLYRCFALNGKKLTPDIIQLTVKDSPSHCTACEISLSVIIIAAAAAGLLMVYRWRKRCPDLCHTRSQHRSVPAAEKE